jgi:hypothetical protein
MLRAKELPSLLDFGDSLTRPDDRSLLTGIKERLG